MKNANYEKKAWKKEYRSENPTLNNKKETSSEESSMSKYVQEEDTQDDE